MRTTLALLVSCIFSLSSGIFSLSSGIFSLSLLSAPAQAQTAATDYDHAVNFLKYKTYLVKKVHATDPGVEDRIVIALDRDLQQRYLHPVSSNPDLIVAAVESNANAAEYSDFYAGLGSLGWERSWGSGFMDGTTMVGDIQPGTLVLDMWDAKTGKLVWRGTIVEPPAVFNAKEADQKFDKATGELLAKFPPKFKK